MKNKRFAKSARRGFTLVELLVVIVIIAILAAFLVVGVMTAMAKAQAGRIRAELMGLAGGLEQYKLVHGEYPPSEPTEFQDHLKRIFPRCEDKFGSGGVPAATDLTEDELLYFWLAGYSDDPKKPLTGSGERRPLFDFDLGRVKSAAGGTYNGTRYNNQYYPKSSEQPYVYFRKKAGDANWSQLAGTSHPRTTLSV